MVSLYTMEKPMKKIAAFSMIELLVVIAIIALLAAIIFPVFATVRENGRQTSSMSNMHDISTKMEQYKLDTQHYPPVLFGYAKTGVPMDKLLDNCTAANDCDTYLQGLYPEYIKSWTEFQDPNNNAKVGDAPVQPAQTHLCTGATDTETACAAQPTGTLVLQTTPMFFYPADAYDTSPQLTSSNSIGSTYLTRYQTSWTSISGSLDCNANPPGLNASPEDLCKSPNTGAVDNIYVNQLRWRNPPSNTYVTSTTYHVQQASIVLVLSQDGSVKKVDAAKFYALDKGAPTIDTNGVFGEGTGLKFWQITL
jgi:prepilin-type N-terminal cleavage/methylation domain-containing protein